MINETKELIASLINIDGVSKEEILDLISVPPTQDMGDFSLPCFKFAKVLRKSPVVIANEIADSIKVEGQITKVVAVNGYVNFYLDRMDVAKKVINEVLDKKFEYGNSLEGTGKTVCMDY